MLDFLDQKRIPRVSEVAKECKVNRITIWRWYQSPKFLKALDTIMGVQLDPRNRFVDYRIQNACMDGNPKAWEANLRSRGIWDGRGVSDGGNGTGAPAAVASVTFVGLPPPPNPANAAKMLPPPGATWTVTPDGKRVEP